VLYTVLMKVRNNKAFTLVELSIVLVIIGLIVGGVVGGQSLIHSARLQSVVQDFSKYTTAVNTYELQYDAIPGDHIEANDYWSVAESGNGDGEITFGGGPDEDIQAWNHLGFAGLIDFYSESSSGGNTPGVTCPAASIDGSGYWFSSTEVITSSYLGAKGNFISLASKDGTSELIGGALTPADAQNIDKKIDNGIADNGKIYGLDRPYSTGCLKNLTATSGEYDLSQTDKNCRLVYWLR
jgi:prepilin-type N-terminal cleavage/methylation domain-containing protein